MFVEGEGFGMDEYNIHTAYFLFSFLTGVRDAGADAVQAVVHHGDHEGRKLVQVIVSVVLLIGVVLVGVVH
jgi:hypothetical protein